MQGLSAALCARAATSNHKANTTPEGPHLDDSERICPMLPSPLAVSPMDNKQRANIAKQLCFQTLQSSSFPGNPYIIFAPAQFPAKGIGRCLLKATHALPLPVSPTRQLHPRNASHVQDSGDLSSSVYSAIKSTAWPGPSHSTSQGSCEDRMKRSKDTHVCMMP